MPTHHVKPCRDYLELKRRKVDRYYFGSDDEGEVKDLRKNIAASFKKYQQVQHMTRTISATSENWYFWTISLPSHYYLSHSLSYKTHRLIDHASVPRRSLMDWVAALPRRISFCPAPWTPSRPSLCWPRWCWAREWGLGFPHTAWATSLGGFERARFPCRQRRHRARGRQRKGWSERLPGRTRD